jgi:hypothetical protein
MTCRLIPLLAHISFRRTTPSKKKFWFCCLFVGYRQECGSIDLGGWPARYLPSALNLNEILFLNPPSVCIEPALCLSCQQFPAKAVCQYWPLALVLCTTNVPCEPWTDMYRAVYVGIHGRVFCNRSSWGGICEQLLGICLYDLLIN